MSKCSRMGYGFDRDASLGSQASTSPRRMYYFVIIFLVPELTIEQTLNWILVLPEEIDSTRLPDINPGDKLWICGHAVREIAAGFLVVVTTIVFESPDIEPIFV
ncbi:hypothetical protein PGT21_020800 [Puccinia graminis f. sp. tritici]|uniref:Uncharacterized protein n=1 Tax=Puccinia graminis f. sp. tritici TaxID=56615 RepID=A0A5B0MA09_PUCGR|nr:hypothetical protein PGT21_020800 [Puccinia graminis f. sp. tritici]